MTATKPKKVQLISVDGTKTHDELVRLLLRTLKDAGIAVRLTPEKRQRYSTPLAKPFRVADLDDEGFKQLYDALM